MRFQSPFPDSRSENQLKYFVPFKMHHQEFEPAAELRNTIKCFWYEKRDFGAQQSDFEVVPDGYAEIIFYFGRLRSTAYKEGMNPLSSPFMIGLLNQPAVFYSENFLEIVGIRFFPWAVFDLLGLAACKNGIRTFEHPIARLHGTLEHSVSGGKMEEAVDHLNQYFLNTKPIAINDMLSKAGIAMRDTNGTMPVSQVAEAAHATVRTLERNFKRSSGHTVKDVSALIRFEQVRNHLLIHPKTNLAGLAHELGYTDQSHLSREFKRYSGVSPAVFARNVKKFPVTNATIAVEKSDSHA